MKALDIVRTKEGLLAIIINVNKAQNGHPEKCSIEYFEGQDFKDKKCIVSWLEKHEFETVDSFNNIVQRIARR